MTRSIRNNLTAPQRDRAAGVILAAACGDALGAHYEFSTPPPADETPAMLGGGLGNFEPGEWTDDTAMAVPIAEQAASGLDLRSTEALDAITARWLEWAATAKDIGAETRGVIAAARRASLNPTAAGLRQAAADYTATHERAGGNGSLMRTAPVALAYLDDEPGLIEAARAISALTHPDPDAQDACVLWCLAIRHAVLHGTFDGLRSGLAALPADRAALWADRLDAAEAKQPREFRSNGWVVEALQAAWSAIVHTPVPAADTDATAIPEQTDASPTAPHFPADHLRLALENAVRAGHDTDTVAGALLGARWGASAIPAEWRRQVHGWPNAAGNASATRADDVIALAVGATSGGLTPGTWPLIDVMGYGFAQAACAPHPFDDGVVLGTATVAAADHGCDAVVSLCRIGTAEPTNAGIPAADRLTVWLLDTDDEADNPNLDFVLADTARAIAALRAEGKRVFVHCVEARHRTPAVALAYATELGIDPAEAAPAIRAALPTIDGRGLLWEQALNGRRTK